MAIKRVTAAVLIAIGAAACQSQPKRDLLAEAEYLCLETRFDEAIPILKQLLLEQPHHAGGHYYLGWCYLSSSDNRWLMVAQGELETALAIYKRTGGPSPIPRFSSQYFELICHIDIAKVHLRQLLFILDNGAPSGLNPFTLIEALVQKCKEQAEAARKVDPESKDVTDLEAQIESVSNALRAAYRDPGFRRRGTI
ncbi:MAG: hypothetical protein AMXMBFR84_06600 [Candidatus Hydrogenedentota bacterium]